MDPSFRCPKLILRTNLNISLSLTHKAQGLIRDKYATARNSNKMYSEKKYSESSLETNIQQR